MAPISKVGLAMDRATSPGHRNIGPGPQNVASGPSMAQAMTRQGPGQSGPRDMGTDWAGTSLGQDVIVRKSH
ncbi:hypothetical protein AMTR_s00065p00170050 [Amborella trichopoda]|uniref:Uncharacterized protein n=1 Tax=Amborella trichopoda TaxID=13333 RepID=U5DE02_AMBTC|nr:hypothetical protein AMTR_s00065p00170050 [Amborella trichopoda]